MKLLVVLSVLVFAGAAAEAQQNPLIRACNLHGALVHIYKTSSQPFDENLFCDFGSGAMIDALTLVQKLDGDFSAAAETFLNSETCVEGRGVAVTLTDLDSQSATFCKFNDGSYISLQALSSRNAKLLHALKN